MKKSYHLCVATAKLKFSNIYWDGNRSCYAFDITFEEPSTDIVPSLLGNQVGFYSDIAEDYWNYIKMYFKTAHICESDTVSVLFSGNELIAIGPREKDLWIDVRNGFSSTDSPKSFPMLDIEIKSLEIY